jgi:hypothetical protein
MTSNLHARRDLRRASILVSVALVVTACGGTTASPSATQSATAAPTASPAATAASPTASADASAIYAAVNEQVREIRGLDEKTPVEPRIVSPEEMATVVTKSFQEDAPPELIAGYDRLYKGLGLMSADDALSDLYVDLLESQVAGLYVPKDKGLYVVSKEGGVGPVERVFYAHEYDHALQDQNFDLETFTDGLTDQTDRQLARQSLVEGDAYVLMTYWLQQHLTPEELTEVVAAGSDPEATAALEKIPPIIQAQLLFSALQGTQWVIGEQVGGGWEAIDRAFADPPDSTEQILHPEKWASREAPIAVDLPDDLAAAMGDGWSVALEDTMGEHQTSIWLDSADAAAAVGWGGDRIVVLEGPGETWAIGWRTDWDTTGDAQEFELAATGRVASAGGPGAVLPGAGGTTRWVVIGSDDASFERLAGALGLAG